MAAPARPRTDIWLYPGGIGNLRRFGHYPLATVTIQFSSSSCRVCLLFRSFIVGRPMRLLAFLFALCLAPPVWADEATPAAPPPAPPRADTMIDFGKEAMPFQADAPVPSDQLTARVASVTYNYFHIFTVTLDNGQVWRQVDGDSRVARFKNDKTEVVTITRGFLDSFHLAIRGVWGDYAVKRIK